MYYTANDLKVHLSIVTSLLDKQKILPTQPEIIKAIETIQKIKEDDLALRLLAACLEDIPKERAEKMAAEATLKAIEEGVKAAKAAALLANK